MTHFLRSAERLLLLAWVLFAGACVRSPPIPTPVEARLMVNRDAAVRMTVPGDWRPMAPSASRIELLGPDGRSRVYLRAMPAGKAATRCSELARHTAEDTISSWGGPPRTQTTSKVVEEDHAVFELRRLDPKPLGEIIWYRIICRNGALAIASCTVLTPRESAMKPTCQAVLDSVDVVPRAEQ